MLRSSSRKAFCSSTRIRFTLLPGPGILPGLDVVRDCMKRLVATGLGLAFLVAVGSTCCTVGPDGRPIQFSKQENIIVWDAERKIQHFVRNASFDNAPASFGFIAPSPSIPELAEADREALKIVREIRARAVEKDLAETRAKGMEMAAASASGVAVIKEQEVAGYEAAVLRATDASALNGWLKANGFVSSPEIEKWTKPYVEKGWYFTAFKVKGTEGSGQTGLVRMTFKTEKPFNPYYVPQSTVDLGADQGLEVFMIANGKYEGTLHGETVWEPKYQPEALTAEERDGLARALELPTSAIPAQARLSYFYDYRFPTGATEDIYLQKQRANVSALPIALVAVAISLGAVAAARKGKLKS